MFIKMSHEGNGLHLNSTQTALVQIRPSRLPMPSMTSVPQPLSYVSS